MSDVKTQKSELRRGAALKLILGVACALVGLAAVYLAIQLVATYGETLGIDERSRELYSRVHVVVHVFGTICAIVIAIFSTLGHKALARLAVLAMLLCGGYGILNMIGFTATNRVSVAEAKTAANTADERQYQAAKKAIESQIEWLRKTSVEEDNPKEKRRLLADIDAKRKELTALVPPKPSAQTVLSDAQATVFSRIATVLRLDIKADTWTAVLPALPPFLLYLTEVLAWIFSVSLLLAGFDAWRQANSLTEPADKSSSGSDGSSGSGSKEPPKFDVVQGGRTKEPASPVMAEPAVRTILHASVVEPTKPSSARTSVPLSGAPKKSELAYSLALQHPHLSTRALAAKAGCSQSTGVRVKRKAKSRADRIVRRFAGNGGGMHVSAMG